MKSQLVFWVQKLNSKSKMIKWIKNKRSVLHKKILTKSNPNKIKTNIMILNPTLK